MTIKEMLTKLEAGLKLENTNWYNLGLELLHGETYLGLKCYYCPQGADYLVSRTSKVSNRRYDEYACTGCAGHFAESIISTAASFKQAA